MATAGSNNLTGEDVPGPDYSDTAISVLFSDRFTRAIRAAEKGRGRKKETKKKASLWLLPIMWSWLPTDSIFRLWWLGFYLIRTHIKKKTRSDPLTYCQNNPCGHLKIRYAQC